jgi:hypothetical protein
VQQQDETTAAAPQLGGELLAAYVATVVTDATGLVWSGDGAVGALPLGECWVITGHNPFSEPRSDAENHAANARLAAVITDAGAEAVPVDGCAPDHSWCEPAFAVPAEVPAELVRRWAADFDQHAVFHLTDLEHRVVRTGDGATVGVRPRRT